VVGLWDGVVRPGGKYARWRREHARGEGPSQGGLDGGRSATSVKRQKPDARRTPRRTARTVVGEATRVCGTRRSWAVLLTGRVSASAAHDPHRQKYECAEAATPTPIDWVSTARTRRGSFQMPTSTVSSPTTAPIESDDQGARCGQPAMPANGDQARHTGSSRERQSRIPCRWYCASMCARPPAGAPPTRRSLKKSVVASRQQ